MLPDPPRDHAAHLLDLTRLLSRMGRGPSTGRAALTGIDRVELAYLDHFLSGGAALFGLLRLPLGYILLDRAGCARLADIFHGRAPAPTPGWLAQHLLRNPRRWALRKLAHQIAIARRPALSGLWGKSMLGKLPKAAIYWNVGHSNLSDQTLGAMAQTGIKSVVLIHDTIPLDHPEFCRPDQIAPFAHKLAATAAFADLVVHISDDARRKTEAHFAAMGRIPPAVTAPLGLVMTSAPPASHAPPYFVTIGTIEPRKNHAFLFDLWRRMGADAPPLHVVGAKGWADPSVFSQMDALIATGGVIHHANLDDGATMSLLSGARALVFPSLAEGFGLPPLEAASLGVPVVANNLTVIQEVVGDFAVYLDVTDSYSWVETIRALAVKPPMPKRIMTPPPWSDHFSQVMAAAARG